MVITQKWVTTSKEKTGRSLEEWLKLVTKSGPPDKKERREWLKSEHGLPTNSASYLAERASGKGEDLEDPEAYLRAAEGYVEAMFSGGKAGLRPIYDALLKLGLSLDKEVKACPCQTIVPLYRKHVLRKSNPRRGRYRHGIRPGSPPRRGPADRYRRIRQKGSHYPPHSDFLARGNRQ